jgi:hypothetical protein
MIRIGNVAPDGATLTHREHLSKTSVSSQPLRTRVHHRVETAFTISGIRKFCSRTGEAVVILLAGGTKRGQNRDIRNAKDRWIDYKERKRRGP